MQVHYKQTVKASANVDLDRRTMNIGGESDGLPTFFTNGSVDDKKYESLLEDLRAHDLLGPIDTSTSAGGASSLFFNGAFSAVFMGNFNDNANKPPPARAPPGLAVSETGLIQFLLKATINEY